MNLLKIFFVIYSYICFRLLLAYLFIPILQRELDIFKDTVWNTHRIRKHKDTYLPDGIPNHIFEFPEEHGLEDCCKDCIYFTNIWVTKSIMLFLVFELLEIRIFFLICIAWPVTDEQLKDAALQSQLLDYEETYIPQEIKTRCEELIPNPLDVDPKHYIDAFLYLKDGVQNIETES